MSMVVRRQSRGRRSIGVAPEDLGQYMRDLRRRRRLSQRQLGRMAGVSTSHISLIESGERNPSAPMLRRLAPAYGVPAEDVLAKAGFLEEPEVLGYEDEHVDWAFECVVSDPNYKFGSPLRHLGLSPSLKRFIVELYEQSTGRKLL